MSVWLEARDLSQRYQLRATGEWQAALQSVSFSIARSECVGIVGASGSGKSTLVNYVCLGWLMGRLKTRAVLLNQIGINVLNMVLALWFVRGLEWGVPGIAGATLIAQISGTLLGLRLIYRYLTPDKAAM
ncbi:hypothetical protein CS369_06965 [Candidatus Symbiopectobacterium sp. 'North America']|uniref:ATP-binding cassette domain-containing protein n=1 Tax=Candidatus Symbiopectobacterium sp. 'North America' TaxID=2794574 RepID=UPI0018CABFA7|nr:ATP-binding cassette domain-containing protein [Candidatus Symbiopectobacterium sp. 'North America']MBG6244583.1 hypothetical protein [Candidatus Symbiopectobacterium sp. 'North America']